jgi:diguanylate cyclase (GGDEF)-like protein/PAS domain S-box-containing protein
MGDSLMHAGTYVARPAAIPTFMVSALLLGVGTFTLVREHRSRESRAFGLFTVASAWWMFASSWMYLAADAPTALAWARLAYLGIPFLAPATYQFAVRVLELEERRSVVVRTAWVYFAACAAVAVGSGVFLTGIRSWDWGPYPVLGPWSLLFTIPFVALLLLTLAELFSAWKTSPPGTGRLRARAFLIAFLVGDLALVDFLPAYGVPVHPVGWEAAAGFALIAAWAIWRHRLADFSPALAAEQLVRTTSELVALCDRDGLVRFANPALCAMVGAGPEELRGRPVASLAASDGSGVTLGNALQRARITNEEAELRGRDGEVVPVSLSACELRDQNGFRVGTALLARDIRYQRQMQAELARRAFYDEVTGLANRALLLDRIRLAGSRVHRSGERFGVVCLELDDFHRVNEAFGREAGDQLLASVGGRLQRVVRDDDTVARIDDDRFGLLLESVAGAGDARDVALRMLEELEPPVTVRDHAIFPSGSVGIAMSRSDYDDPAELLRDAQAAASRARGQTRERITIFGPGIREHAVSALEMAGDLRRALVAGEFELYFQPIARLADLEVVAVEALLRWRHPRRGLLAPAAFLHVAREARILPQIGWWVLEEALGRLASWRESHPSSQTMHVHVNLSVDELTHPELLERIEATLARTGVEPRSLVLEITERTLLHRTEDAIGIVDALRSRGVRLCVDDFGTGYSSLAYLGQYPLDVLKIDATFVRAATWGSDGARILETVLELSRNLGMVSVAEGVDTTTQLEHLRRSGCALVQGFLLAEPMPAGEVEARLAAGVPLVQRPAPASLRG